MLQSMGSQRVGHDLATEQQQYLAMLNIFSCVEPSVCFLFLFVGDMPCGLGDLSSPKRD